MTTGPDLTRRAGLALLTAELLALAACSGGGSSGSDQAAGANPASPPPSPPTTPPTAPPPQAQTFTFEKTQGPDKNPLKGWNSSWWNDHPEASVGFQYVAWKAFEPQNNVFNPAAVEEVIARPGSRGRHLILRFYSQWDGAETRFDQLACPEWMASQQGVRLLTGVNGSSADFKSMLDFNDAAYVRQCVELIQELARTYENDPRIFAIQFGLLGYWGEWHTHAFTMGGQRIQLQSQTTQTIANAYKTAFTKKRVMARYPWAEPVKSLGGIGFHNDFFKVNNGHSDEFDRAVNDAAKWREGPIGGEAPPMGAGEGDALYTNAAKALSMIETGRYSTMAPGAYRRAAGQPNHADYLRLHRRLGYNFQIDEAQFVPTIKRGAVATVTLKGTNSGIAPFYYDWDVEFALVDQAGAPIAVAKAQATLSSIMPDAAFQFDASLLVPADQREGAVRMAVRIVQPGAAAAKTAPWKLEASNVAVQFANRLEVLAPSWNAQNALVGGWSVLGAVSVTA